MPECDTCEYGNAHGWFGLPTGQSHCRKCHAGWRGTRAAHCPMCHRTFTSDTAAQRHKRTDGGRITCSDPATVMTEAEDGTGDPAFALSNQFGGPQWCLARDDAEMAETRTA